MTRGARVRAPPRANSHLLYLLSYTPSFQSIAQSPHRHNFASS
jgi:hypothetical protein